MAVSFKLPIMGGCSPKPTSGDHRIFTFDYNGDLIDTQWVNDGEDGIVPPSIPHEFLTYYGHNGSYTNVTEDRFIGFIYNTTGGETRIRVRMSTNTGLQPTIYLNKTTTDILTVNWGDGNSQTSSSNGNISIAKTATYAAEGDYWITITCAGGYNLGQGTSTTQIFGNTNYQKSILSVYLGANVIKLSSYMCQSASSMCCFSIGSFVDGYLGNGGQVFNSCYSLKGLNIPTSVTTIIAGFSANCYSLNSFTYGSLTSIANQSFINCYGLRYLSIPNVAIAGTEYQSIYSKRSFVFGDNVTNIPASAFSSNYAALEYVFPKSNALVTLSNINAFTGININCKIYMDDSLVATAKTATNWITYANYIYPLSVRPNYPVML